MDGAGCRCLPPSADGSTCAPYRFGVGELVALSKAVSRVLRHEPWVYELELDAAGWTPVDALRDALRRSSPRWKDLDVADIEEMIRQSVKCRYEIVGPNIRALYGHSVPDRIVKTPATPPAVLFHGTASSAVEVILGEGLRPMRRQYVHLSVDVETAHQVGRRKGSRPVILEVAAGDAHAAGISFYRGNEKVWLTDAVPAGFLSIRG